MAFEHNKNSGSVFRNDRKLADTDPDFSGSGNVDGVEYHISLWSNPGKNGKKGYFRLAFLPVDKPARASKSESDAFDDDIPF